MRIRYKADKKRDIPDGLLKKCNHCRQPIFVEETEKNAYICPKCGGYFRMPAQMRLNMIADEGSFVSWDRPSSETNLGDFPGYVAKHEQQRKKYGVDEAVMTGSCTIGGHRTAIAVCESRFFMASMGRCVGERIALMAERAQQEGLPIVIVACSGGARMQEGIHSLMQMAKTSGAIDRFRRNGGLYISVLTDPTYGGVTASFAMQADVIIAEKHAMIGFAGQRVIAQTVGAKLPKGFQSAEFLYEHGQVDIVSERKNIRGILDRLLCFHEKGGQDSDLKEYTAQNDISENVFSSRFDKEYRGHEDRAGTEKAEKNGTAWEKVKISRQRNRPVFEDYIERLFTDFIPMAGDRRNREDASVIGGVAMLCGRPVTVIGQAKGHTTAQQIERNFGMPGPEGYEKVQRLVSQAEKFNRPVICFVDTPGADCGIEAEEKGQGGSIARLIARMMRLRVPVLSIIIGEGGSGGALALACGNEVWMLENAVYSILSPEGFASILWKDAKRADEAAQIMGLTARYLKKEKIIEDVIEEPDEYTVNTMDVVIEKLRGKMIRFVVKYSHMKADELERQRYDRFSSM